MPDPKLTTARRTADAIHASAADLPYPLSVVARPHHAGDRFALTLHALTEGEARKLVAALRQYGPMILGR